MLEQERASSAPDNWVRSLTLIGLGLTLWGLASPVGVTAPAFGQTSYGTCGSGSQCPMGDGCCNGQCVSQ